MQLKRCYINFFNATRDIIGNVIYSKARGAGDISASYSEFSFNAATGFAEGVVEFDEQVWSDKLADGLTQQGAACITILTFTHNDGNESAGAALVRVWKSAKGPGFNLVTSGECNARLLAKAAEITQKDEAAEPTFDEKTATAEKISLLEVKQTSQESLALQKEMKETVATKEDLAKVGEAMVTKDDLTKIDETVDEMSLRMVTKEEFIKMKDTLTADFSKIISSQTQTIVSLQETAKKLEEIIVTKDRDVSNQAQTIKELETVVITKDRDNQQLEERNHSQRCVLARLNQEKTTDANTIKKLNEKIQSKDKIIIDFLEKNPNLSSGSSPNIVEEKICEIYDYIVNEESRKRKAA